MQSCSTKTASSANKSQLDFDIKYNLRKVRKQLEDKDAVRQEFMSLVFDKLAPADPDGVKAMRQKEFYEFYNSLSLIKDKVQPQLRRPDDLRPDVIFLRELGRDQPQKVFDLSKFKAFCEAQSLELYSDYEARQALALFL